MSGQAENARAYMDTEGTVFHTPGEASVNRNSTLRESALMMSLLAGASRQT